MKIPAVTLLLMTFLALQDCGSGKTNVPPVAYEPRANYLSQGDAVRGRKAFADLKCHTCHAVAGDDFDIEVAAPPGPRLGTFHAGQSPDWLASAIVWPAHTKSKEKGAWQSSQTAMPEFADAMTVREFLDVIAYLQTNPAVRHTDGE